MAELVLGRSVADNDEATLMQAVDADTKNERVRTPLWRRFTALFSLGSLVVLMGVLLAAVIGAAALLMLFILERAIAG